MNRNDPIALAMQALSEELRRDVVDQLFWSQYQGSIMPAGKEKSNNIDDARPSGKPIDVNPGIKAHGIGDRMLIPMQQHLAGPPTYGSATLIGNEESPSRRWGHIAYNMVRHAVTLQEGEMEELREDALKAAEHMKPDLSLWHAQMENYFVSDGLYCGVSENLYTTSTHEDYGQGLGIAKRYHPNMYVAKGASADTTAMSRVGTLGKFPTSQEIYLALRDVNTSNVGQDKARSMNRLVVQQMRNICYRSKLKPLFNLRGKLFWGWILTPEQTTSLLNDETVSKMFNSQQYRDISDHPLAKGSIGVYGQFVFFEDAISIRSYAPPSGMTDTYAGAANADLGCLGSRELVWDKNDKSNPRFCPIEGAFMAKPSTGDATLTSQGSIIFGASMLGKADRYSARFTKEEEADYGNWKGIAAKAIYGYERQDFVPESQISLLETTPASCTNIYNDSSMLVFTFERVA